MTNKEFYKEQILDIVCSGKDFGFDKETNKPCDCKGLLCSRCCFNPGDIEEWNCRKVCAEWCNAEYVEPCPFEKDELVEVSNDKKSWSLRYFSHIDDKCVLGKFSTFAGGCTSEETDFKTCWKNCRKYGTLGGLVKGAEE